MTCDKGDDLAGVTSRSRAKDFGVLILGGVDCGVVIAAGFGRGDLIGEDMGAGLSMTLKTSALRTGDGDGPWSDVADDGI